MSSGVDRLLAHASKSGTVERGAADEEFARQTVDGLGHDYVMYAASKDDWATAMSLSYSQARKSVSMLLLAHGWRVPDQRGKHMRIAEAVNGWLGSEDGNGPRLADLVRPLTKGAQQPGVPRPTEEAVERWSGNRR